MRGLENNVDVFIREGAQYTTAVTADESPTDDHFDDKELRELPVITLYDCRSDDEGDSVCSSQILFGPGRGRYMYKWPDGLTQRWRKLHSNLRKYLIAFFQGIDILVHLLEQQDV